MRIAKKGRKNNIIIIGATGACDTRAVTRTLLPPSHDGKRLSRRVSRRHSLENWGKPRCLPDTMDVEGREAGKRRKRVAKKNAAATCSAGGC